MESADPSPKLLIPADSDAVLLGMIGLTKMMEGLCLLHRVNVKASRTQLKMADQSIAVVQSILDHHQARLDLVKIELEDFKSANDGIPNAPTPTATFASSR